MKTPNNHVMDHQQRPQSGLQELALFAGAGGGILGGKLLGWQTVCAVEREPYATSVLVSRQNDGVFPPFPIWDDVCTFNGKPWRGLVDVVSGGFPCQDISAAGKGEGITGKRSGLWSEMARIICEVGPRFVFVENSPLLTSRGIDVILGDLAEMGYDAAWGVFSAASVGAEHVRDRVFILADSNVPQLKGGKLSSGKGAQYSATRHPRWGKDKPGVDRVANGLANRTYRLKAIGNGQVPSVVKLAWETLTQSIER